MNDPLSFLKPEMSLEFAQTFTETDVKKFGDLINDHAPVHFDKKFAQDLGFSDTIVHGFLVSGFFSGILGERLPGPQSVINQTSFKYHLPVILGQKILYIVSVTRVTPAVRAVSLNLKAINNDGKSVITGSAICSFPAIKYIAKE